MTVQEWLGSENKLGIDIWERKYRRNGETFDQWIERVSGGNKEIARMILEKKFLFGGRILSNRGMSSTGKKVTYSNCYVIEPPEDNIESIFDRASKLARTYSYGGGCGLDLSKLAPRGAKVNNTADATSGSVSFMDLYSLVTGLIGQNGRRGALMLSLSCDHPDLEEFIGIKSDLDKVTKANISIRMTDEFMNAVVNKEMFTLKFSRPETGETITKEVNAYEIFKRICEMNNDYAEPGMLFWDRIENYSLLSNDPDFKYAGVNPCVTGDTMILTDHGYQRIADICDMEVNVWNGYEFSKVTPHVTGHNQPMKIIKFSDGSTLECTTYHKFILNSGNRVEAKDLKVGDKLVKCDFPVINNGGIEYPETTAYTMGFFMGDGSCEESRDRLSIKLYGKKNELIPYLAYEKCNYCESFDGNFLTLEYTPDIYNKELVPDHRYSVKTRLDWLAGYLDSDGTVQSKEESVSISSTNRETLLKVKRMLNTLGCNAWVSEMYGESNRMLPKNDSTGEYAEYHYNTSYRLLISAHTMKKLIGLGLNTHRIVVNPKPNRDASRFITVTSVEDNGICDTVYCFNEPKNHSGIFNGVITAQCAEEPLPSGGSCLLGSLNLAAFVDSRGVFNFDELKEAVHYAVFALNEVLDEGLPLHPLKEQRESVRDWRQIGLGIFGLADCLIKMGITYGSKKAVAISEKIGFAIADEAIYSSAVLASKYGSYPKYNAEAVQNSEFFRNNTTSSTVEAVSKFGLRNSQLLTIAPTGTLSTMIGVSGGIEPIFANFYTRKTESLHGRDKYYKVYTPIVEQYMKDHNLKDDSDLPEYFVTAQSLHYMNRVEMQAAWQRHIDASISSTVNVPNSFTTEDVGNLYIQAWKNGLKGITLFRDGCKRAGILTTDSSKKEDADNTDDAPKRGDVVKAGNSCVGLKRTLYTGCGTLHCEAFFDPRTGDLRETYFSKGSSGGCNNFMIGLSRMISLAARGGVSLDHIVDQLKSSGTCPSYAVRAATKKDTSKGSSCPVAIGNALVEMHDEFMDKYVLSDTEHFAHECKCQKSQEEKTSKPKCPQCGGELVFEGGCNTCKNCGWSKCE